MKWLTFPLLCVVLFSCVNDNVNNNGYYSGQAYVPVYDTTAIKTIEVKPVQSTQVAGKIYTAGNYIYQCDENTGIHIIDNSNTTQPHKICFIKIPYCNEVSVKGNYLYTNNYKDLLVFNILNHAQPQLVKRVPNVFKTVEQYPPFENVYFQCHDTTKGPVLRWELQTIPQPKCKR
jgi:hypothetical protein